MVKKVILISFILSAIHLSSSIREIESLNEVSEIKAVRGIEGLVKASSGKITKESDKLDSSRSSVPHYEPLRNRGTEIPISKKHDALRSEEAWNRFVTTRDILMNPYEGSLEEEVISIKSEGLHKSTKKVAMILASVENHDDLVKLWKKAQKQLKVALVDSLERSKKSPGIADRELFLNVETALYLFEFLSKNQLIESKKEFLEWFRQGEITESVARYFSHQTAPLMKKFWSPAKDTLTKIQGYNSKGAFVKNFLGALEPKDWEKLNYKLISSFYKDSDYVTDTFKSIVDDFRRPEFFKGLSVNDGTVKKVTLQLVSFVEGEDRFRELGLDDLIKFSRFTSSALRYIRDYAKPEVLGDLRHSLSYGTSLERKFELMALLSELSRLSESLTKQDFDVKFQPSLELFKQLVPSGSSSRSSEKTITSEDESGVMKKLTNISKVVLNLLEKCPSEFSKEIKDWLELPNVKNLWLHVVENPQVRSINVIEILMRNLLPSP